jgi:hypothetical protein
VISAAKSFQDGQMAEQEAFAKSLPSESRHILNATMAYVPFFYLAILLPVPTLITNRVRSPLSATC